MEFIPAPISVIHGFTLYCRPELSDLKCLPSEVGIVCPPQVGWCEAAFSVVM